MHEHHKPLAAVGGGTRMSPSHGLAQCPNASCILVTSSAQHGSGVANPPQPSTGERERAGCATPDLEAVRPSGSGHRCHEGPPYAADELASLGDATCQRRQPLYPQSPEAMVKPRGPVSTENVLRLLEYQQYRCALTGRALTPETAALDHIVPIRSNGQHVIENTQVLHKDVNRAKGTLTNAEFIALCREVVAHMDRRNADNEEHA